MLQKILTFLGRGPVWQAISKGLSAKMKSAETEFIIGQEALLEEFKLKEETLLRNIASNVLGDLFNGNK